MLRKLSHPKVTQETVPEPGFDPRHPDSCSYSCTKLLPLIENLFFTPDIQLFLFHYLRLEICKAISYSGSHWDIPGKFNPQSQFCSYLSLEGKSA